MGAQLHSGEKDSPVDVSAGNGNLEAKQEDEGEASSANGPDQARPEVAERGGQSNFEIIMPKDDLGYTSFGIEESQDDDNSENSQGTLSEEGAIMQKEDRSEANSVTGGINDDGQSFKEDSVDSSEVNSNPNEVKLDDPSTASRVNSSELISSWIESLAIDDPKHRSSVDDPQQKLPIDDSSKQENAIKHESPTDDDTHDSVIFQGDDGKDRIKAEGLNICPGERRNAAYDVAEVLND